MDGDTVLKEIYALQFPDITNVIVVGGAYLALLGLRKANDIDLVVSNDNWIHLVDKLHWNVQYKNNDPYIQSPNAIFDVWLGWYDNLHKQPILFHDMKAQCIDHQNGFLVPSIKYQIMLKRYNGRDKDIDDIHLLQTILT